MKRRLTEPSGRSASHAEAGAEVSAGATPSEVIGGALPKANRAPAQIDSAARSGAAERAVTRALRSIAWMRPDAWPLK
jgi:hypothetical protein